MSEYLANQKNKKGQRKPLNKPVKEASTEKKEKQSDLYGTKRGQQLKKITRNEIRNIN